MKKIYVHIIILLSAALAVSSCKKESFKEYITPEGNVFVAAFESVRTSLDNMTPKWVEGDAIGITTSTDANVQCTLLNAEQGVFNADAVQGEAPFYAVYPYAAGNTFDKDTLIAEIPAVQQLAAGQNVAPGALVAACKSSGRALDLKNCVALLKIDLPRADIKKIVVSATATDEYLAGKFEMDLTAEPLNPVPVAEEASKDVTLLPEGEAFAAGTYYITVIPGVINAIKITFTNTSDESVSVSKTVETTIARNAGSNFGSFFVYEIGTPAALASWAKSCYGKSTAWDQVVLTADIDMAGTDYSEAHYFKGTFDGKGHKITGLKTPLFGNLYGTVKNVDITAEIEYPGKVTAEMTGTDYGVGILAHYVYCYWNNKAEDGNTGAYLENVTTRGSITFTGEASFNHAFQIGGIVGAANGCPMTDCTNYASVTVQKASIGTGNRFMAGGICGTAQTTAGAMLTRCTNYGNIEVHDVTSSNVYVGGISGCSFVEITYDSCTNYGNVFNDSQVGKQDRFSVAAGISGMMATKDVTFTNCKNYGPIENASCCVSDITGKHAVAAGILGYMEALSIKATITNCFNYAGTDGTGAGIKLNPANGTGVSTAYAGGIGGYLYGYSVVTGCENFAPVSSSSDAACSRYLGGIAGYTTGNKVATGFTTAPIIFTTCKNHGKISNKAAGGSSQTGGIIGGATNYVSVSDCHNDADLYNSASSGTIYLGGIIANTSTGLNLTGCTNSGKVTNEGNGSSLVRFGGLIGNGYFNNAYSDASSTKIPARIISCSNSGEIVNNSTPSSASANYRMGGIIGSETSCKIELMDDCHNTGNLTCTQKASCKELHIGGIAGYIGSGTVTVTNTTSNCDVNATLENGAESSDMLVAQFIGKNGPKTLLGTCGIAGSVNGTALTEENYNNYWYASKGSLEMENCYFIQ